VISDSFSLMRGGPVYRVMHGLGVVRPGVPTAPLVAVLLVVVAFVPLVFFAAGAGMLLPRDGRIALLGDYAVLARLLVAIPVLVLAAAPSDDVLRGAMRYVGRSGLVPDTERARFEAIVHRARALRDSSIPELSCALLAIGSAFWTDAHFSHVEGLAHWALGADGALSNGTLSSAGTWFAWVAAPVFRFVGLIWIWRFLLWAYVLWRLSRLHLSLHAAHPDGAGGLGFLSPTQARFAVMAFTGGCLVSGDVLVRMVYANGQLQQVQWELIGYIVGSTLLVFAPLLCMVPRMASIRRRGLLDLGALGQRAATEFDARWRPTKEGGESLLESPNPSAIADFTAMYGTARSMSVMPVNRLTLLAVAFLAALPFLPALLHAISIDELLHRLLGVLA
jgi:hypothetical protein